MLVKDCLTSSNPQIEKMTDRHKPKNAKHQLWTTDNKVGIICTDRDTETVTAPETVQVNT